MAKVTATRKLYFVHFLEFLNPFKDRESLMGERAHRIWRSLASDSTGNPLGSSVDCAKDPWLTETTTRPRRSALKMSMLLEISAVTKSGQC